MPQPLTPEMKRLLDRPNCAHLATAMPDGSPHSLPVWVGREGHRILVCAREGSLKAKNTRPDPRVALSVVDCRDRRVRSLISHLTPPSSTLGRPSRRMREIGLGVVILLAALAGPVAADVEEFRGSLQGITSIRVAIEGADTFFAKEVGLSEAMLRSDIEPIVKEASITILPEGRKVDAILWVTLQVKAHDPLDRKAYAFAVDLQILQGVSLQRNRLAVPAFTWLAKKNMEASIGKDQVVTEVRETIRYMAHEFVYAYREANRKPR